jgi:pimeloyl-ACP methyl ester carboxylesterase
VWAAVERPDAIRSLVLIGGFFQDTKLNPVMAVAYWLMMHNPWRAQAWRMFYRTLYPTRKPADFEDYLDELTANLSQPERFDAVKAFPNAPRQPWKERLPRLTTPTLIVMGTKDPDFPDPVAEGEFAAAETRGRLVLIEEAGHYPQTEMPEQTAPAILDFLAQV